MNSNWSELNKQMQLMLKKRDTYKDGVAALCELREDLFRTLTEIRQDLPEKSLSAMPCPKAKGYHNKTVAYSIWHIFRIEDIVANTIIANSEQILFSGDYLSKTRSNIITTGNELTGEEIVSFSESLDIDALYEYAKAVRESTEKLLGSLAFDELKIKVSQEAKQRVIQSECVSSHENAVWLIDYWCGKDIRGLVQMPFSRHWIMHTEAILRIADKLK